MDRRALKFMQKRYFCFVKFFFVFSFLIHIQLRTARRHCLIYTHTYKQARIYECTHDIHTCMCLCVFVCQCTRVYYCLLLTLFLLLRFFLSVSSVTTHA